MNKLFAITLGAVVTVMLFVAGDGASQTVINADSLACGWNNQSFARPIDPETYIIRPGEILQVILVNTKLSPLRLTVDAEGMIVHQSIGVIDLSNHTLSQARKLLRESLSKIYNADEIVVSISGTYPVSIQVTGAVNHPGRYTGFTSQSVSEMIDSAGGIAPGGSSRRILFSGGPRPLPADIDRLVFLGDDTFDPQLCAGRTIYVPLATDSSVEVLGEVSDPRVIELVEGDDVDLLVKLAGGAFKSADVNATYAVNDSTRDLRQPNGIKSGDILIVPRSTTASSISDLGVYGAVVHPGRYPYTAGMTVSDLIMAGGGQLRTANVQRTTVFRQTESDAKDRRLVGRYPILVGGANQADRVEVGPGDSVYVPVQLGYVRVAGQVTRPGLYPYTASKDAAYYVNLAGGFGRDADESVVGILDRVSGATRAGTVGEIVFDGDEITALRREKE